MSKTPSPLSEPHTPEVGKQLDAICNRFEAACRGSILPRIEDFLNAIPVGLSQAVLLRELIHLDVHYRRMKGDVPRFDDYAPRFPDGDKSWLKELLSPQGYTVTAENDTNPRSDETPDDPVPIQLLARYKVLKILGQGAFGVVYLARDEQLHRLVAIKVPHRKFIARTGAAEDYLAEARTVANLDHPNIVPVYDVGSTDDCPCFIVSKFIEGGALAERIESSRPSFREAAELVATVAEALHYAHRLGLVHRDIKPSNILVDTSGKPFVVDFGLALKEEDIGKEPNYAGTPAYMSPEQARGEGHRVDGRSDIFSLGVVLYELLTRRRPFRADSRDDLMEQIMTHEVRPPRQWDETIPKELERICLRSLSKRASDRYTAAKDLADDLHLFLSHPPHDAAKRLEAPSDPPLVAQPPSTVKGSAASAPSTPKSDDRPIKIVPKGLRSFDAHDADFFLDLLPGPCDRDGLPDSIRFWKTRIEETDPENTFAVGLIYGPSGCGKSSLVKAGLLPRLCGEVIAVYLEATAGETETRLLNRLRKRCPNLPFGLKQAVAALRRGSSIPGGKKVLIVLDQFEQWLQAKKDMQNTELMQALRQCDGGRVQCMVMVRDDFWMAATRLMRELEIRLVEGQNSAPVDLFDLQHGKKVLAAFGHAFGKIPDNSGETGKEHKQFLEQAISGLAQEGKIICVRLALFAEMMKGKPWTPTTLNEVGGTAGVGVAFLEATFSATTAPPDHRYHQKAARAVLKSLLLESAMAMRTTMRSYAELLVASGYVNCPEDFADLVRILDSEVRLITPTDPAGKDAADDCPSPLPAGEQFYQLTHDYLVPSLLAWLTRMEKETARGRAKLVLADRAEVWNAHQKNRHLPSFLQWISILVLTQKENWTKTQWKMMRKATRYHVVRGLAIALFMGVAAYWGGNQVHSMLTARALRDRLLDVRTIDVPSIVVDMPPYRRLLDPLLRNAYAEAEKNNDSRKQLHASLALLPVDAGQVEYLYRQLLEAELADLIVIRQALLDHKQDLTERLWTLLENPKNDQDQRLRATCALAAFAPDDPRWKKASGDVAARLVTQKPFEIAQWTDAFQNVATSLIPALAGVYRDGNRPDTERHLATDILAVYAKNDVNRLADLLMDADEMQFAAVFPAFQAHGAAGVAVLRDVIAEMPADGDDAKERLAKRQANAAVALVRMNRAEAVWPLLKFRQDPRVRSYIIHRFAPMGAAAAAIVEQLEREPDVSTHRALILSLGEYDKGVWSGSERGQLIERMRDIYQTAADPGLHAAAEWLLRSWSQNKWLDEVDAQWAKDGAKREAALRDISKQLASGSAPRPAGWYVTGQGHTMVIIPGPTTFLMGSPVTEASRENGPTSPTEAQHRKRIERSFAIAAKEVTVEQFQRCHRDVFQTDYKELYGDISPYKDCPVNRVSWYLAAAYCNWLSQQEGIPSDQWYYEKNPAGQYDEGMKSVPGRTGYRLPTEAEWECACRAGTSTSRYFGETEDLLPKYAWYSKNAQDRGMLPGVPQRFGELGLTLKPNDYGLFGMLGNALEWCHSKFEPYRDGDDTEYEERIDSTKFRILRGGSFNYLPGSVRAAYRVWRPPSWRMDIAGFRPARTINPTRPAPLLPDR